MSELSVFTEEEVELLSSVLYKVGVWVSHADDVDGEEDDEKEMKALVVCIRAVAKKYDGPGLVDDIAREVFVRKERFEDWADDAYNVLPEVKNALAVMRRVGSKQDLKNYKMALYEVSVTVARAFGEFGEFDDEEPEGGVFGALIGKITSGFSSLSVDDKDHPMNISAAEDEVISQLKAILKED